MSTEALHYHKMYKEHSPEYNATLNRFGRHLYPAQVQGILAAHGFTARDLLDDESDNIASGDRLPDTLDAALLFAWLGY